ncbi:hypothetical protein JCM10212_003391 [Sporobolomyces blumeae]
MSCTDEPIESLCPKQSFASSRRPRVRDASNPSSAHTHDEHEFNAAPSARHPYAASTASEPRSLKEEIAVAPQVEAAAMDGRTARLLEELELGLSSRQANHSFPFPPPRTSAPDAPLPPIPPVRDQGSRSASPAASLASSEHHSCSSIVAIEFDPLRDLAAAYKVYPRPARAHVHRRNPSSTTVKSKRKEVKATGSTRDTLNVEANGVDRSWTVSPASSTGTDAPIARPTDSDREKLSEATRGKGARRWSVATRNRTIAAVVFALSVVVVVVVAIGVSLSHKSSEPVSTPSETVETMTDLASNAAPTSPAAFTSEAMLATTTATTIITGSTIIRLDMSNLAVVLLSSSTTTAKVSRHKHAHSSTRSPMTIEIALAIAK